MNSNGANGWVRLGSFINVSPPSDFTRLWPFHARQIRRTGGLRTALWRQAHDGVGRAHELAAVVRPLFDLDLALAQPLRPNQNLPGNSDQVGSCKLRPRALVTVVV